MAGNGRPTITAYLPYLARRVIGAELRIACLGRKDSEYEMSLGLSIRALLQSCLLCLLPQIWY